MSECFASFSRRIVELTRGSELCWFVFRSIASSNDLAGRVVRRRQSPPEPTPAAAFVAWGQHAGRGRHGRRWESRDGEGVWATLLLPVASPNRLALLPLAAGVALAAELQEILPSRVSLKWPNDLYVKDAKLGGILVEGKTRGEHATAVLGFGVNIGSDPPRPEDRRVTSIAMESGEAPELADLAVKLVSAVYREIVRDRPVGETLEQVRRLSLHKNGDAIHLETGAGAVFGVFRSIDENGLLVLDTERGVTRVSAGDVMQP